MAMWGEVMCMRAERLVAVWGEVMCKQAGRLVAVWGEGMCMQAGRLVRAQAVRLGAGPNNQAVRL
eukprot:93115-Chlamydomonas_euryale.AAC.1